MHDQCYSDAMQHPECWPILDNPYTEIYDYTCDEANKKLTCTSKFNSTLPVYAFSKIYIKLFTWLSQTNIRIFSILGSNDECEMFICECDRKAAECFGVSPWHPEHEHLPSDRCQ